MHRTPIATLQRQPPPAPGCSQPVAVAGWVRSRRDSKAGISFLDLNDGSCLSGIQVVASATLPEYESVIKHLTTGCAIQVEGDLVPSQGRGQAVEIQARQVLLTGPCDPETYPIQKQATSLEHLRSIPHLRPRTRTFQAVMRIRSRLGMAIHRFFDHRGFTWVHTPIITASDCEGAGAMFRVSTLSSSAPPRTPEGTVDFAQDFFAREAWLTVSGQLEGENYACALGDIYTFGPTFRAENSNTPRHLAEFWMIEPEMAFCDLAGDRRLAQDFVQAVLGDCLQACGAELEFLEKQAAGLRPALEVLATKPFVHITYTEAVERLTRCGRKFEFPVHWGMDLQAEHERHLTEVEFDGPVVVTDYPQEIKAFYMRSNDDGKTVAAMDVLVPRMGELIGGAQREERLDRLEARMRACGLDPERYRTYLDLRRFGTVPHAGFGLGFERLVCLATGMQNIRDVIPFPRTPGSCP